MEEELTHMHLLPADREGTTLMGDCRGNERCLVLVDRLDVLRFPARFLLVCWFGFLWFFFFFLFSEEQWKHRVSRPVLRCCQSKWFVGNFLSLLWCWSYKVQSIPRKEHKSLSFHCFWCDLQTLKPELEQQPEPCLSGSANTEPAELWAGALQTRRGAARATFALLCLSSVMINGPAAI